MKQNYGMLAELCIYTHTQQLPIEEYTSQFQNIKGVKSHYLKSSPSTQLDVQILQ